MLGGLLLLIFRFRAYLQGEIVYQRYTRHLGTVVLTGHQNHGELTGMVCRHFERVCLGCDASLLLRNGYSWVNPIFS